MSFSGCKSLDLEQALGVLANCPIENLDLTYMDLTELPSNIGDLSSLKHVRLGNNPLSTLPESFYGLSNMTSLRLGNNEGMDYEGVINSAKAFPSLTNLWLQYCGFETLPAVLGGVSGFNESKLERRVGRFRRRRYYRIDRERRKQV